MKQIPMFTAEQIDLSHSLPPLRDYYHVRAYWSVGDWWKLFPDQWFTREKAEEAARKLPLGWHFAHIVKIPGINVENLP